ncbi:PAS domain-containing sensor histidine kinase [Spirosoma rhododendri]|uniref:histidine kinase n=1 Tax=Spirosoma rhododendri TaxID=2728024 RepID=A0A7L5DUD6_9BACT|nr:PAS domain-containing protein [Spirosoma rhododendri]QJD79577.1 PAS domain-containing protein [Spirosoma rhododendri]
MADLTNSPESTFEAENRRLTFALAAAGVGTWDLDIANQRVWWDDRCKQLYGVEREYVVPYQDVLSYIHPDDRARVDQAVQRAIQPASGGAYDIEFRTAGAGKKPLRWLHCRGQAYFDPQGQPIRFAGTAQDITERILAEQRTASAQQQILHSFAESPVGIALIDRHELRFQMANALYGRLVGREPDQLVGKPLLEALPELKGQGFDDLLRQVLASGTPFAASEVAVDLIRQGQLETIYVDFNYQPRREAGTIVGVLVVATDVTSQVRSRRVIEQKESQLRSLVDSAPFPIGVYVGPYLTIQLANSALIAIWGKGSDVIGRPYAEVLPELNPAIIAQLLGVYATGQPVYQRGQRIDLLVDGQWQSMYFDYSFTPLRDDDNQVYGVMSTAFDVTPAIQVRQALQRSEQRFRALVEEAPVATCLFTGPTMQIEVANRPMIAVWGKDESVLGKALVDAVPELKGQPFLAILDEVFRTGQPYSSRNARAELEVDGVLGTYYFDFVYKPLVDSTGVVYGIMDMAIDVTEQVLAHQAIEASESRYRLLAAELDQRVTERTQELLHANQDLSRSNENLLQFAYIASHDLQEPLRKIQSFSTLLEERFGANLGEDGRDLLERMRSAGSRMSQLIKDLLVFSRISTRQQAFGLVSLSDIMKAVLTTLELLIDERDAQVAIGDLPVINGDESQLSQLLQNLLTNALKFTRPDQRPVITVTACRCERSALPVQLRPNSPVNQFWQLDVTDQGIGFEQKYTDRIFQVFQRLHGKQQYAGTGVGLAICQRVVENHGGCIVARSEPGQGATFTVYLPA